MLFYVSEEKFIEVLFLYNINWSGATLNIRIIAMFIIINI